MRYMFLIYSKETPEGPSPEERARLLQAHSAVLLDATSKGVLCGADPLQPTATATTVRMRDGQAIITDGPFAETKEQLGGYYIIECPDLDDAIGWAKRIPTLCKGDPGCIEIRPLINIVRPV